MKKFIAILIIFCGFQIDSSSHQGEEDHHSQSSSYLVMDQDIERYTDFWGDKNSQRFLRVMLDVGYGHAMQRPQEDWEDMDWAWEQKEKAFPLLLEILRREPNENKTAPELEWTNISRKGYAIEYVLSHPEGDLKPFVKEARKQLPYWLERKVTSGMNSIFIGEALELLSTKGDASDIPLIEGFLEDPNRNNRSYARKNLAVLKERLAKEFDQNRKDRVARGDRDNTTSEYTTVSSKNINSNSAQLDGTESNKSPAFWYILSALSAIVLVIFFRIIKGKPTL